MVPEVKVVVCIVISGRNCQISLPVRNSRGEVDCFQNYLTGNTFLPSTELVHAVAQGEDFTQPSSDFNAAVTSLKKNTLATVQSSFDWVF